MTFTELRTEIMDRLNLSSTDASTRVGRAINRTYRKVTTSIGMQLSRRATTSTAFSIGVSTVAISNCEKVINVYNRAVSPYVKLEEVSIDEIREDQPYPDADNPTKYAVVSHTSDTVTIEINRIPQTGFTLYLDIHQSVSDLSGSNEPAFPESFHDVLIEGVLMDEYRKLEKPQLAQMAQQQYDRLISDLKMWIAKGGPDVYQNKLSSTERAGSGGSGSGGAVTGGALSWTQTGLITFDRDPSAPFAVTASSAVVTNLDADKVDGYQASALAVLAENETITGNWEFDGTCNFDGAVDFDAAVDVSGGSLILPQSSAPAQTAEGSIVWDTDDDLLTVGDGASRKVMVDTSATQTLTGKTLTNPTINAGSGTIVLPQTTSPAQTAEGSIVWDTDDNLLTVGDGASRKTMVDTDSTQTLTGKTLTAAVLGGTTNLSGGQIAFPAAQSASADANTLDDYEEGNWTPVIGGSGGTSGQAYSSQIGRYVKVGRLVTASFDVTLSTKGTITSLAQIQGLPFTIAASCNPASQVAWFATASSFVSVLIIGVPSTTAATLFGATGAVTTISTLATADLGNTTRFIGTITYEASA